LTKRHVAGLVKGSCTTNVEYEIDDELNNYVSKLKTHIKEAKKEIKRQRETFLVGLTSKNACNMDMV
jgi:hypothetical protein